MIFDEKRYRQRLCRVCYYSKTTRSRKVFCKLTGKEPDFHAFCPHFKLYVPRDDKYSKTLNSHIYTTSLLALFFVFYVLSLSIGDFGFSMLFFPVAILVIGIFQSVYPLSFVINIGKFNFLFIVTAHYVLQKKKHHGYAENEILKQQIIRLLGRKGVAMANEIYKHKNNLNDFQKYYKKISDKQKVHILAWACRIWFYDNFENTEDDSVLIEISELLGLHKATADEIIRHFANYEKQYAEKRNSQQNRGKRLATKPVEAYLKVLGLDKSASMEQIKRRFKKLALKYHPDKHIDKTAAEQQQILKRFQEITEAYNFLKDNM